MESFGRLLLRRPEWGDLGRHFEIHGDPKTNLFNPSGPVPDLEASRKMLGNWIAHWDEHGFGMWAVSAQDAPAHILGFGGVSYRPYGEDIRLNLGYRFAPQAWDKGYATELGKAALAFAFGTLEATEIYALIRPANLASIHVAEKLGMTRAGTLDDVPGAEPSLVFEIKAGNFKRRL